MRSVSGYTRVATLPAALLAALTLRASQEAARSTAEAAFAIGLSTWHYALSLARAPEEAAERTRAARLEQERLRR
jgi:hypothetical protein